MGEVSLAILGKAYAIACDAGQEARVLALGKYLDQRLRDIGKSGAATDAEHLLVLVSLMLADELHETHAELEDQRAVAAAAPAVVHAPAAPLVEYRDAPQRVSEEDEHDILEAINHLASRIDSVATRLQKI